MRAGFIVSALFFVFVLVSLSEGKRYTVNFRGLVGELCGSAAPSGCPDPSPCTVPTGSPTATPSSNPSNPTPSSGATASASTGATASASSGATASASTGATASSSTGPATSSFNPTASFVPSVSTCPVCPTPSTAPSCPACLCSSPPSQTSFPSVSRTPSVSSTSSQSASASGTQAPTQSRTSSISLSRSFSPSFTPSPSPNVCVYDSTSSSIGVGLLFDRSAWARSNANPAVYGTLYAINQINAAGGVLVNNVRIPLNPIIYDTLGLPNVTVDGARSLISASCVSVLVGTDTSAARRAVENNVLDSTAPSNAAPGLLLDPQPWEGADWNAGVAHFGSSINQNVRQALIWAVANNKSHIHLLGSDDVDSRVINAYARQFLSTYSPSTMIIGEDYMPVGTAEPTAQQTFLSPLFLGAHLYDNAVGNSCNSTNNRACTLLFSTVYGQGANRILHSALAARYLTPNNPNVPYTVLSLRNTQYEFANFSNTNVNGQFMGTNYVDAVSTPAIATWRSGLLAFINSTYNDSRANITTAAEINAYNAIQLWAAAVSRANTSNPGVVRTTIMNVTYNSPLGAINLGADRSVALPRSFYVSRLSVVPLQPLIVTPVYTVDGLTSDIFPVAGNLTGQNDYTNLVGSIKNYYNSLPSTVSSVGLGWASFASTSPTDK